MPEYHSFRLHRYSPPEKTAADYSSAEQEQFRAAFAPVARRYRLLTRGFLVLAAASFLALLLLPEDVWIWIPVSAISLAVFASILLAPECPACKRSIQGGIKTFCPECGGHVSPGGFFSAPACLNCGKKLWTGRGRSFKYRCCTHCGLFLDDKGL